MDGDAFDLDLDAAILPDTSLGGVPLRERIIRAQGLFSDRWGTTAKLCSFALESPFVALYRFLAGAVVIYVDVRNGKIFMVSAGLGYRGSLLDRIQVGMRAEHAFRVEPRLYYDEGEGAILCQGVPGLSINLSADDPPPDLVPRLDIASLNVFASETRLMRAQSGDW